MPAPFTPPPFERPSRIPPVPPTPSAGENDTLRRAPLPPDRAKTRLVIALVVSLGINLIFFREVMAWGKHLRAIFSQSLSNRQPLPPTQFTLLPPVPPAPPASKTLPKKAAPAPSPTPAASPR